MYQHYERSYPIYAFPSELREPRLLYPRNFAKKSLEFAGKFSRNFAGIFPAGISPGFLHAKNDKMSALFVYSRADDDDAHGYSGPTQGQDMVCALV